MSSDDLLTQWAQLFVSSLEELGVLRAVLSPGSRSTPLTWAITQSSRIAHNVVIDERSAAFFALGQAKYTGRPSVLICTSGSAAANYLPAIVEASLSHTPLLVVTADRPFELQQCDAPQTIDQVKLYGSFVRGFFDLGMPDPSLGALRALRRQTTQALHLSESPDPGPVHLNFRARKPLEPQEIESSPLATRVAAVRQEPITRRLPPRVVPHPQALRELAERCDTAKRGVVTLGPNAPSAHELLPPLRELLSACNLTLLVESTSQARHSLMAELPREQVCDAFDWLYATRRGLESFTPDFVLQLGSAPTSGSWSQLLAQAASLELHVLQSFGWSDPSSRSRSVLHCSLPSTISELARLAKRSGKEPSPWHRKLAAANDTIWSTVAAHLKTLPSEGPLAEPVAVATIMAALPSGALLAIGNSLPVREIDQYAPGTQKSLLVLSQRGANGIDGLISGASGAAAVHSGPTVCLLGDISFLHDVGGLWTARDLKQPFVIVVLNNDGGRIFEQLPLLRAGVLSGAAAAPWLTPHDLDLQLGAHLFGVKGLRVGSRSALQNALDASLRAPNATVIDVRVGPSSADCSHQALVLACETALAQIAS